ncbi:hypothetical protein NX059_000936 [Plenodomus lindquistii]|nr:hypothetical protein NX059_000936 [Plenodomus lindquistii]
MAEIRAYEDLKAYAEANFPVNFSRLPPPFTYSFRAGRPTDRSAFQLCIGTVVVSAPCTRKHSYWDDSISWSVTSKHDVYVEVNRWNNNVQIAATFPENVRFDNLRLNVPFRWIQLPVLDRVDGVIADEPLATFVRYCFEAAGKYGALDVCGDNAGPTFEEACRRFARGQQAARLLLDVGNGVAAQELEPVDHRIDFEDPANDLAATVGVSRVVRPTIKARAKNKLIAIEAVERGSLAVESKIQGNMLAIQAEKVQMQAERVKAKTEMSEVRSIQQATSAENTHLRNALGETEQRAHEQYKADQEEIFKWRNAFYALQQNLQSLTTIDYLAQTGDSEHLVPAEQNDEQHDEPREATHEEEVEESHDEQDEETMWTYWMVQ